MSLLDDEDESDEEVEADVAKALGLDAARGAARKFGTELPKVGASVSLPEVSVSAPVEGEDTVKADRSPRVSPPLEGHNTQHFSELGRISTPRRLMFQGPDIDPFLRYALEVDIVKWMIELRGITGGLGAHGASASATSSSQAMTLPMEFENFDVEGSCREFIFVLLSQALFFDFICDAEFQRGLSMYSTEYLGRITTSLCLKALLASRATVQGAKKDEAHRLDHSIEILRLAEENKKLQEEKGIMEILRGLFSEQD
ncbi:hypothetical protein PVAP13_8KG234704 [Panicum virgatum]|uniref:Uncharacterized protein n=1 Tax=Panicum virgatum TaxID=38727 RepID=A0A8T0PKI6_PANVG|nr:hypothetical protein PVAP13_8KG234704 [Panicum virgatum]